MRAQFGDEGEFGWTDFEEDEADYIEGKYVLTIHDPDGEEYAVIIHRSTNRFPLEGPVADEKRERARRIVEALNAYDDPDFTDRREYA